MSSRVPSARMPAVWFALAATLGLTLVMEAWLELGPVSAGLWSAAGTRWDDTRLDLDMWGAGYLAVGAGAVSVVALVACGVATRRAQPGPRAVARTASIVTLIAMVVFLGRFFLEGAPGLGWAAVVGPLATGGAIATLR